MDNYSNKLSHTGKSGGNPLTWAITKGLVFTISFPNQLNVVIKKHNTTLVDSRFNKGE